MKRLYVLLTLAFSLAAYSQVVSKNQAHESSGIMHDSNVLHVRTNLLYDALVVPNVGIEFGLSDHTSLVGNVMFNWIGIRDKQFYWRILSGDVEWRYWLGTDENTFLRKGHHLGVYAAFYRYDVELGTVKGQLADFNYGGGISYGYSTRLNSNLSLDLSIGIGYMGGKYKKYKYLDGRYVWQSDEYRNYIGPTKAEATLVWHWKLPKRKSDGTVKKGGQP